MLRFRFVSHLPPGAANLAYVQVPLATPETHLILTDFAADIPENIVDNYGVDATPVISITGTVPEAIDTDQFIISNRSVISKNVTKPSKLFYQTTLGLGTFDVYDKEASASNLPAAREIIRKHIRLLNGQHDPIAVNWDIEVLSAGSSANTFGVAGRNESIIAQYHAADSLGGLTPNFREVINATPILSISAGDYTVTDNGSTGFEIGGLSAANTAPAIALYGTGTATVTSTLIDFAGGNSVQISTTGDYRPIADVVADINAMNVPAVARALSDHDEAKLTEAVYTIIEPGVVIRHDQHAHVRYEEKFRIRALRPSAQDALSPWFPRISDGSFVRNLGDAAGPYRYDNRDYDYQVFSTGLPPYKDVSLEEPTRLDGRRLQVSRRPLKSKNDITIFVDEIEDTTLLDQVDLQNGILFLSRAIQPDQNIDVSYIYEERNLVYQDINLNPTLQHSPDNLNKFIGIYIIPREFLGAGHSFERTIYHMVRDTAQEIETDVPALLLSDGSPAQAKLLGIYRVVQTEVPSDIDIIDTRSWGGGLRSDVDPRDVQQPETQFYADLGAHFDGQPFPDSGTIIIELPEAIPGTGQVDQIHTLYDGYGNTNF
ncbi:MAG: hypothetical protein ACXABY_36865, partial [Candidatus Thorarchaeota archaeon]